MYYVFSTFIKLTPQLFSVHTPSPPPEKKKSTILCHFNLGGRSAQQDCKFFLTADLRLLRPMFYLLNPQIFLTGVTHCELTLNFFQEHDRHRIRVCRRKFSCCSCLDSNLQPFHHKYGALPTT